MIIYNNHTYKLTLVFKKIKKIQLYGTKNHLSFFFLMLQAAAGYVYKMLNNSSLSISHMVGPVEQVALANHPIKGFYFMTVGLSQVCTDTSHSQCSSK